MNQTTSFRPACFVFNFFLFAPVVLARPEFPDSGCEDFNASESNSAIIVCRSVMREHYFRYDTKGFAQEPVTFEQDARGLLDWLLLGRTSSANYQNPERWQHAVIEYVRSRYGLSASLEYIDTKSQTFKVIPADIVPPWGDWYLKPRPNRQDGLIVEDLGAY